MLDLQPFVEQQTRLYEQAESSGWNGYVCVGLFFLTLIISLIIPIGYILWSGETNFELKEHGMTKFFLVMGISFLISAVGVCTATVNYPRISYSIETAQDTFLSYVERGFGVEDLTLKQNPTILAKASDCAVIDVIPVMCSDIPSEPRLDGNQTSGTWLTGDGRPESGTLVIRDGKAQLFRNVDGKSEPVPIVTDNHANDTANGKQQD